ncbi:MFS transporter [Carboxydochorda subterranea]|uniref:MFS transporter n=1 Tax=Carboxydichorda subterranea TaxID=3109565 RepID=A0ABZ1C4K8_9FIRM|nr:MFS transporter [Limnochorda sp. L945t]WRP18883.1 MFS transporter [Limnochorda sp. L945t]
MSPLTKLIFGSGDIYGGGQNIVNFLYLIFLTDVVRIRPALAGLVFLVGRIWDAVTDPAMGVVTDRTRTRWGRRRPYFLAATVLVFVSYVLLWAPVTAAGEWARFAYCLAAYLFFDLVMTMTMVPYSAMSAELTLDYHERTSVMSYRLAFSMGATILTALFPMWIVERAPDPRTGYLVMAVVFGALSALPWGLIFKYCPERPSFQRRMPSLDWRDLLLEPWRLRAFRTLVGMYLAGFIALDVVSSLIVYFMRYNLGRPTEAKFVMGTPS